MNDWVEFEIDPALLAGTGLEILPKEYYTLSDNNTFRVAKIPWQWRMSLSLSLMLFMKMQLVQNSLCIAVQGDIQFVG